MSPASTHTTDQAGTRSKHKTLSVLSGWPTATPTSVRIQRQNWPYRAPGRAELVIHTQRRLDDLAHMRVGTSAQPRTSHGIADHEWRCWPLHKNAMAELAHIGISVRCRPSCDRQASRPVAHQLADMRRGSVVGSQEGSLFLVLPSPGAGKVSEAFRLAEGEVPWVAGDEVAAGVWFVGFDAAGAEQDVDTFAAQILDAAAEWGTGGKG